MASFSGGVGAEVSGDIFVTPGETLYIEVGTNGQSNGSAGFNGGAVSGGAGAGGGAGASDIRFEPRSALNSLDSRLIIAAGGGGGGGEGGEAGGAGGNADNPGEGAEGGINEGGGAGTESSGGSGGSGCNESGESGELGFGGKGGATEAGGPGGGGGGGRYGGGGGGGACVAGGGGGGGGSSLVPLGGGSELATSGPIIELIYHLPPTIQISKPAGGATYTQGQSVVADYSCTADEAAITTCSGPVANGAAVDTATLGPHTFTVEAEDDEGATTFTSVSYKVQAAPTPTPTPSGSGPKSSPPNTSLGAHPKKTLMTTKKKIKVKFGFSSDVAGATFECKLDKGAYASCTSPKTYKVKLGSHTFSVRAKAGGVVDPSPATFRFKVKKKT